MDAPALNRTARRWCFTLNNWTPTELERFQDRLSCLCSFAIIGKEHANEGTPHLQGFFILKSPKRFSGLKILLPRAHIEIAKGTNRQNITYCSKEDEGPWVSGTPPGKNNNDSQLDLACSTCTEPTRDGYLAVAQDFPAVFVKYWRGFQELQRLAAPITPRSSMSRLFIFWGPPGTHKSRVSYETAKGLGSVYYKNRGIWWDHYRQEDSVVIDDFYGWIKWDELLKICDRYPYKVQCKGGTLEFTSKYIFITSNVHPSKWYKFDGYDVSALMRRTCIIVNTDPDIKDEAKWETPNGRLEDVPIEIINQFNIH
ncbi:replication-association protein [Red mite associated cyclovirus 1]|nr:replication-association protein [Red mite associated cyclovirus 1]